MLMDALTQMMLDLLVEQNVSNNNDAKLGVYYSLLFFSSFFFAFSIV